MDTINFENTTKNNCIQNNHNTIPIKLKKKRGRKKKNFVIINKSDEYSLLNVSTVIVGKKKRGRKPKYELDNSILACPKKRGRKPKVKHFVNPSITKCDPSTQLTEKILHLPIRIDSDIDSDSDNNLLEDNITKYNPNVEEIKPYDPMENNQNYLLVNNDDTNDNSNMTINNKNNTFELDVSSEIAVNDISDNNLISDNVNYDNKTFKNINSGTRILTDTMIEFININENNWPVKSSINCWWCKHSFDSRPCFIPQKYLNGVFSVYGCFCSFNCALAFLIDENIYCKSTIISLLKYMYRIIYPGISDNIEPSPSWKILTCFGGILEIDEYRKNINNKLVEYKLIFPPITSLIPKIEKFYINDTMLYTNNSLNTSVYTKKNINNSLEKIMGIKFF